MTFFRQRAMGAWTTGSPVLSGEMENFDENLSNAIDGKNGGTYALVSQLVLGGAGLRVDGPFETNGTNHVKNGMTIDTAGTFACSRQADFTGVVNVKNGLNINTAGSVSCSRPATFSGTVNLDGLTTVGAGGLACNGAAGFADVAVFSGNTYFAAPMELSEKMTLTGPARINWRLLNQGDADATVNVTQYDEVRLPRTVGASRTLTISNTGAVAGSRIRISRNYSLLATSGTFYLSASGGTISPQMGTASGERQWIELTFDGSNWFISGQFITP